MVNLRLLISIVLIYGIAILIAWLIAAGYMNMFNIHMCIKLAK